MARLPTPGKDKNKWGDILNEFLATEHYSDGSQKPLPQSKVTNLVTDLDAKASQTDLNTEITNRTDADNTITTSVATAQDTADEAKALAESVEAISTNEITARQTADTAHVSASDPHSDRAYARSLIALEDARFVGAVGQPAYLSGFSAPDAGLQPLLFYFDSSGVVHIEGHVKFTSNQPAGTSIFQLPSPLVNLVSDANSGMESGISGYVQGLPAPGATISQSNAWASHGTYSLRATNSTPASSVVAAAILGYAGAAVPPPHPIVGERYSASARVKDLAPFSRGISLNIVGAGGPSSGIVLAQSGDSSTTDEVTINAPSTVPVPAGITLLLLQISSINDGAPVASDFFMDDVQIVQSAEPPLYEPLAQYLPTNTVRGGSAATADDTAFQVEVDTAGNVSMRGAGLAGLNYGFHITFRGV